MIASILGTPAPVGTAIAVAPGEAVVGHASEPDDVVVLDVEGGAPRVAHERAAGADPAAPRRRRAPLSPGRT
jgi:hypothetical protein